MKSKEEKVAAKIIRILQDAGYTPDEMLQVIEKARIIYNNKKKIE